MCSGCQEGQGRLCRFWERTSCGLKGKCWPCLGREDGEAASTNGLSGRLLRKKIKVGWGGGSGEKDRFRVRFFVFFSDVVKIARPFCLAEIEGYL